MHVAFYLRRDIGLDMKSAAFDDRDLYIYWWGIEHRRIRVLYEVERASVLVWSFRARS